MQGCLYMCIGVLRAFYLFMCVCVQSELLLESAPHSVYVCVCARVSCCWSRLHTLVCVYTLRLLLIAGTNFSEFSGDQKNR